MAARSSDESCRLRPCTETPVAGARPAVFQLPLTRLTRPILVQQPGNVTFVDPSELFSAQCLQDPYPIYERMRAAAPVHQIGDSQFYAACSWDAVNDALGRPEDFSSNLTATMIYTADGKVVP